MPQENKTLKKLSRAFRDAKNKVRDVADILLTDPRRVPVLVPVRVRVSGS